MTRTLIIVDDNQLDRDLLKVQLKNDYLVMEAENGKELLTVLDESYEQVSAILLDIVMPVISKYSNVLGMLTSGRV